MTARGQAHPDRVLRLRSQRIVTPGAVIDGEIVIRAGRIVSVGPSPGPGTALPGAELIDLGSDWIVPGFIDGHVHGGGGAQCNTDDPDEVTAVAVFHARHGTTALLATTVSAPVSELVPALQAIDRARGGTAGAAILGAHLEGPFVSPSRPGAMDPASFLVPDAGVLARLLATGADLVAMMTLAPELPGAIGLVRELAGRGVIASLGHSEATAPQTLTAIGAGACAVTHTFNAMGPLHHREPGLAGVALDRPELSCELIADAVHVSGSAMRLAHRAKGTAGIRLVTDAISAAGMPDGGYRLGAMPVRVSDGRAHLVPGEGSADALAGDTLATATLAGSTLTMDAAVRIAVRELGVELPDAVTMAAGNPARLLGLAGRKGSIVAGLDADLAVLRADLSARATMVGGRWALAP